MTANPAVPAPNQSVSVTATITDVTNATLIYRTDFAAEQSTPMTSAGGDAFTASIPGAAAGHLIRYRIEATNAIRTSRFPRIDDTAIYQGVVAASGITSAIPVLEWFIADADYNAIVSQPDGRDRPEGRARLQRDGLRQRPGQHPWRRHRRRRRSRTGSSRWPTATTWTCPASWSSRSTSSRCRADWSDHSHGRALLSWDSYALAGVVNAQVLPVRTQRNSAFQGLYTYVDLFDGTWRDREGYSDDQFFKASHGAFDATRPLVEYRFEKKNPDDGDFAPIQAFLNGVDLTGTAQRNFLLANADIPQMINYAAVTAIVAAPRLVRQELLPQPGCRHRALGDHPVGPRPHVGQRLLQRQQQLRDAGRTGRPGRASSCRRCSPCPEWRQMYFRRLRTLVNEILAPGRLEALYDAKIGPAQPEAALDFAAWPHGAGRNYANQRTTLFNAIAARRTVFANDARLPGQQSAAPNIVINEIQHSPAAGNAAEFIELYNPSATEAVDLSGWTISDAIDLPIQPGAVILPHGTMVFVANDPTFRATYGATVFVGGIYSGDLSAGETITLLRRDGSVADSLTYGGAGWPVASGGPSLELLNPAADNADPANWALSVASGGTPGAPNQSGGGGDTIAPDTTVTSPAANAVLGSSAVTMTGTASDNVDVDRVNVTLQNTTTGAWLQPNGTFGASAAVVSATLVNDTGTTTGWQVSATLPNGAYALTATAVDTSANADPSPATRSFSVSASGGPDTVAPNGTLSVPTNNQVFTTRSGDHVRCGNGRPRHGQGRMWPSGTSVPASGCTPTARSERGSSSVPPSRWTTAPR